MRLEGQSDAHSFGDRLANVITAFGGSMSYVWIHVAWFTAWIGANLWVADFDPFPFSLLTMVVSLEAIFLSTFVLIAQNRQGIRADRRAKVDLEVNLIAEEEITKLIGLVDDIHRHLGLEPVEDGDVHEMKRSTDVATLAAAADEADERIDTSAPDVEKGPG
jgi:uncharacterized membrane protein